MKEGSDQSPAQSPAKGHPETDDEPETADKSVAKQTPRAKFVRWGAILLLLFCGPFLYIALFGLQFSAPQWAAKRIEAAIASKMGDGRLDLDRIEITLSRKFQTSVQLHHVGFTSIGQNF